MLRFLELHATFEEIDDISDSSDDSSSFLSGKSQDVDRMETQSVIELDNTSTGQNMLMTMDRHSSIHCSSDMREIQKSIHTTWSDIIFENTEIAKIELYNMLTKANCPKYLFKDIQRWGIMFGRDLFGTISSKCNNFVNSIGRKVYGEKGFRIVEPKTKNLVLPRGSTIPVTSFSLKGAIVSLLTNPILMRRDNHLLNSKNPYKVHPRSSILGDINTGWWYYETTKLICSGSKDILLPLILFIDGSKLDNNGRLSVIVIRLIVVNMHGLIGL